MTIAKTIEINGTQLSYTEFVNVVSKRESRRDKPGVQVKWQFSHCSKSFDIEADTEAEARSRCEKKARDLFAGIGVAK